MINYTFQQFFIVIGIMTFIYLAYILLRYYRKEINALLSQKGKLDLQLEEEEETFGPFENFTHEAKNVSSASQDYERAEIIIPKIKEIIIYAGINNYTDTELYQAINTILNNYPIVKDPVIQEGITELIIAECEKHGAVKPEKGELEALWELAS